MRGILFSFCALVCATSVGAPIGWCWTDKIENSNDGTNVYLMKGQGTQVFIKFRGNEKLQPAELSQDGNSFMMREGDTAFIHGGVHNACTLVSERQENELGIRFTAVFRPSGLPADEHEQFYSGEPSAKGSRDEHAIKK